MLPRKAHGDNFQQHSKIAHAMQKSSDDKVSITHARLRLLAQAPPFTGWLLVISGFAKTMPSTHECIVPLYKVEGMSPPR